MSPPDSASCYATRGYNENLAPLCAFTWERPELAFATACFLPRTWNVGENKSLFISPSRSFCYVCHFLLFYIYFYSSFQSVLLVCLFFTSQIPFSLSLFRKSLIPWFFVVCSFSALLFISYSLSLRSRDRRLEVSASKLCRQTRFSNIFRDRNWSCPRAIISSWQQTTIHYCQIQNDVFPSHCRAHQRSNLHSNLSHLSSVRTFASSSRHILIIPLIHTIPPTDLYPWANVLFYIYKVKLSP
jgi:hypothetical protein